MGRRSTGCLALSAASLITALFMGWRKMGGTLSGGMYSDSHSWAEMRQFLPEFLFTFSIVFLGVYIWESIKPKIDYFICPRCDKPFSAQAKTGPRCPDCGESAEPIKGYYERHPDKKLP